MYMTHACTLHPNDSSSSFSCCCCSLSFLFFARFFSFGLSDRSCVVDSIIVLRLHVLHDQMELQLHLIFIRFWLWKACDCEMSQMIGRIEQIIMYSTLHRSSLSLVSYHSNGKKAENKTLNNCWNSRHSTRTPTHRTHTIVECVCDQRNILQTNPNIDEKRKTKSEWRNHKKAKSQSV